MYNSIDGIIWEADADTLHFSRVAGGVDDILGYSADDWLSKPDFWQSKLHPDDADWVIEACIEASRKREAHRLTYRMVAADGRAVWLQDNVRVRVHGDSATLTGIMIDVTELVEQRRELTALNQQNARFRALHDLVPVAIWEEDWTGVFEVLRDLKARGVQDIYAHARQAPDFVETALAGLEILSVNNAAVEMFRAENAQELIRRSCEVFQADHPDSVFLAAVDAILHGVHELEGMTRLRRLDGGALHVMYRIALPDIEERAPRVVICEMDVSAAHRAQERFELVSRATTDVISDWDIRTGQLWWNENLRTTFGHDPAGSFVHVDGWKAQIHPEDSDRVINGLHEMFEGTGRTWKDEYRFYHADGSIARVLDQGFVLRDEGGQAVRMVGSMADVTRERETEVSLRQAQKLEAVGQLTGGVSHDFNNLLTIILGNAELLVESLTDRDDLRAMAEMAVDAAERGAELTGRLLAFARQQPLAPVVTDLNGAIRSMEPLLRHSLSEAVEIDVTLRDDLWPTEIDPGQFEAALLNLALNARDAMPAGGRMTIETANTWVDAETAGQIEIAEGGFVVVTVTDTGTGMTRDVLERVLEPFFTTKGKGSGLGLPMAYGFVRQSGGNLKIYSELGEGTSVKLYFPRSDAGEIRVPQDAAPTSVQGGCEHVLVVEDNALVREHVVAMLRSFGYRVSEAENAATALELLSAVDDIELLFTDIVMPGGMNGRDLAEAALRMRPDLRVLYTSGYTENAIVHQGRLYPGVELLSKPYRRQDLALKLRAVLDRGKADP